MQVTNKPSANFGVRLGGVEKLTNHYRAQDFEKIKIYAQALKKVGDDATVLEFGVGKYNECFGNLRTRIYNKKFGDEVLLESEEVRGVDPYNALHHALASNFGYINDANSVRPSRYSSFYFDKLKVAVEMMETGFLRNIAEKHNLKPTDVLKKYGVEDGHWQGIAENIERGTMFKLDCKTAPFRPAYGNLDLVQLRNRELQELLDIIG